MSVCPIVRIRPYSPCSAVAAMQAETHRRFFKMMKSFGIHVRNFRADCGSYSEDIVKTAMEHITYCSCVGNPLGSCPNITH